jgi:C-terminal processing protease CtpA/Prc
MLTDSDKRLMVKRESGEFGFRIHGAKPVVVSAIETGTAAENSGLKVGDIIISINDMCVLDASHSEFVNVAHSGSDVLELEVARTCDILTPQIDPSVIDKRIVLASILWKFSIGTKKMKNCWQPRYFCLKTDNCLYYYKSASLKRVRLTLFTTSLH